MGFPPTPPFALPARPPPRTRGLRQALSASRRPGRRLRLRQRHAGGRLTLKY